MKESRALLAAMMIILLPCLVIGCVGPQSEAGPGEAQGAGETATSPVAEEQGVTGDEIQVVFTNTHLDLFGEWVVQGLIRNVADYPVGDVALQVTLFDVGDNPLYEASLYEAESGLVPGETIPFSLFTMNALANVDHVEVNVADLSRFEKDTLAVETRGATMAVRESGLVQVVGEIVNPSDQPAVLDRVLASVQDDAGELLMSGSCDVCARYLEPGGHGPFRVQMFGGPSPTDFSVYLSAVPYPTLMSYEIELADPSHTYTDILGGFHLLGEVSNNSDQQMVVSALSTLYDAEGRVLDATAARVEPRLLNSGETGYYDLRFGGGAEVNWTTSQVARWEVQIDRWATRPVPANTVFVNLATSGEHLESSDGVATFSGNVVNDTGQDLQAALVLVGVRQRASGVLVGLGSLELNEPMPAGGQAAYSLFIYHDPEIGADGMEAFVQAMGKVQRE